MDRSDALRAYAAAAAAEREQALFRQEQKKAAPLTRRMSAQEKSAFLGGSVFAARLFQAKKRDRAYRALSRGELAEQGYRDEYEQLEPLILREIAAGNGISLPFLRSVLRSRVTPEKARRALAMLEGEVPRRYFAAQQERLAAEVDGRVARYLRTADLAGSVPDGDGDGGVIASLMRAAFPRGLPDGAVEQAYLPGSVENSLLRDIAREYPVLSDCWDVCTEKGEKVSALLRGEARRARQALCREMRKRFPAGRIRALLAQNASVARLQRQKNDAAERERRIRTALLDAIPAHYRDLFPAARQMRRRFILHVGPTNSGKTYEGVGRLHGARHGIYLGPLRLLAAEQFESLNLDDVPCSLVTGEEQIRVPGSQVQSSTVEMADLGERYDVAVIDECQMVSDRDRGGAWTAAILGLCADEIHACASSDAEALLTKMILECGDELSVVRHERMTPLELERGGFRFPSSVQEGDALIVFSKARVHAVAAELRALGWKVSLIYGALPPDVRRDQARRFQQGETDIVVSTDAIAMGMNLPIKRVVFLESEKYDGDITRTLTDAEFKQIAGRAGRYGIYDIGWVNAYGFKALVAQALRNPLTPLTEAVIGFPESLLGIPLPLTQILSQWIMMQDKGCFSKASTVRMAALAAMLETPRTDKNLLYRFLCVPFDETDPDLLTRWKAMYHAECRREHAPVLTEIPESLVPEDCTVPMLDGLEADYRRCDLYYNYARLFLPDPDEILSEIQRRKDLISQGIIHILSTQKLNAKTCIACKKRLPWNWPYRMCDICYRKQSGARFSGQGSRRRQGRS